MFRRGLGQPALFAIIYTSVASAIYFSLGVVAQRALGLTPAVYLLAGVFFVLASMTYVEGASLHQDRGGATVFARYAFNELVSFVAGWMILLDYTILIAVTAFSATNYLAAFYGPLGSGTSELLLCFAIILYVAIRNIRGFSKTRVNRIAALVVADIGLQVLVIVLGLFAFFHLDTITDTIHFGDTPTWGDTVFALGVATVVFTGLESASGLSGEVAVGRRGLKRLVGAAALVVLVVYTGIAVVAITALPVVGNATSLGRNFLDAPMLGIAESFEADWLADTLKYVIAAVAAVTLIAAANSAMMGLSRLAYSLSTNRQIPSGVGRLHPTRATPYVVISIAAVLAAALTVPQDLELMVGIFAFGALIGLTIAHLSIVVLRYKEPDAPRPYRIPLSIRVRGADLPLPAVLGAVLSGAAWVGLVATHQGARWVGTAWLVGGLTLYLVYRTSEGKSIFKRVTVPEAALLRRERREAEYGSILVPLMGTPLDDDIVQTAGRLAAEEDVEAFEADKGATIEALWIFEVPMSLPIDAALPETQLKQARAALARAKAVGEEYEGVEVATATVRARRAGHAIVEEAKRRGVQAVVLAAEEPSKIRGGALLGGRGGPLDNFVGEATKYVLAKAPCQVILTAPPASEDKRPPEAAVASRDGASAGQDA
ncbi:MAG TPA: amino acid permease [Solirubrobacteraceae bacterium]|jgi:APA family basic amino acid/polyamine antiporter